MKSILKGLAFWAAGIVVPYLLGVVVMLSSHWLYKPVDFGKFDNHAGAWVTGLMIMLVIIATYGMGGGFRNEGHK